MPDGVLDSDMSRRLKRYITYQLVKTFSAQEGHVYPLSLMLVQFVLLKEIYLASKVDADLLHGLAGSLLRLVRGVGHGYC